jgi:hypothetical protein
MTVFSKNVKTVQRFFLKNTKQLSEPQYKSVYIGQVKQVKSHAAVSLKT